jgi:hypothetical protein
VNFLNKGSIYKICFINVIHTIQYINIACEFRYNKNDNSFLNIMIDKLDYIVFKYIGNSLCKSNSIYDLNKLVNDINFLHDKLTSLNKIDWLLKNKVYIL